MTLRGLAFIALRFYAVSLLAGIIPILPTLIAFMSVDGAQGAFWTTLSVPLAYFIMAAFLWVAAGRLASSIAREFNPPIQLQITLEDALAFAFVFLGLYFVLNSAGSTLIQLLNLLTVGTEHQATPEQSLMTTGFYRSGITTVAGLASIFCSRVWARKLARRGLKVDEQLP